jgi:DNA polymerase-3 subunit delta
VKKVATAAALDQALAQSLPAAVWIATDEPLLQVEFGDRVRVRARALGHVERVVIDIGTGFDGSRLVGESRARSLFGERRLLDLRLTGKPPRGFGEALVDVVNAVGWRPAEQTPDRARPPDGAECAVLVTSPRLDKTTTGAPWFGQALDAGLLVEGFAPERSELERWIAQRLAANDQRADSDTLQLIAERTEGNLVAAQQAVDRLALLAPAGRLEPAIVDEVVTDDARFDSFALVETALSGRLDRALVMLDGLHAEDAPLPLLAWALADALRRLLRAIEARESGQPLPSALRAAGIFGRREPAYRRALATLSREQALAGLRLVARLDRMAKGVDSSALAADPWSMAERILIVIAGVKALEEAP